MANLTEDKNVHEGGAPVTNYIQQIKAGEVVYDIATHHGITFHNGSADRSPITWNGITDLDVIIPSITDLVQNPVRYAGNVNAQGEVIYVVDGTHPAVGDLVYVLANCEFGGKNAEAGDMALYDGSAWHVISGEDQVKILNGTTNNGEQTTVSLGAAAKPVIFVEGKELALGIDYADVRDQMSLSQNNTALSLSVTNGNVEVSNMYIGLSQGTGTTQDISTTTLISLPTALASGVVTISEKVLASIDFEFNAGSLPTVSKNAANLSVTATTNIGLANSDTEKDFVANIDASIVKSVAFAAGNDITYINSITETSGTSFVSGLHIMTNDERTAGHKVDLSILQPQTLSGITTFVSGLSSAGTSGDLVSSVTIGTVSANTTGSDFLRGLGESSSGSAGDVITNVSFGSLTTTEDSWFVRGLDGNDITSGFDVVTSVSIATPELVADNGSGLAGDVLTAASVNNHVLSFDTGSFMKPVKVNMSAPVVMGQKFNKGGVALTGNSVESANFLTGGITQGATSVSYKSIVSGSFSLSGAVYDEYVFDKAASKAYEWSSEGKSLSMEYAGVTKGGYELSNTGITAYIPSGQVVVDFSNAGTLPSFSVKEASGNLTGSVDTALTTTNVSWLSIDGTKKDIAIPGAYTLTSVSGEGSIEVAQAGSYSVASAIVTIPSNTFVTDVFVSGTTIKKA